MSRSIDLQDIVAELFAPGLDLLSFRARAGKILRNYAECHQISFVTFTPRTRNLDVEFDPYFPEMAPALQGYGRHMAKYPCFNCDPTVNGGLPFLRGDYLSDEEFYSSPIYLEGFKPAGISDHAAILLPTTDDTVFFLGLEKRDGTTYQPKHRDHLTVLQPHLANARLLAQALATPGHALTDPAALFREGITARESDVLALLAAGKSNPEIGVILAVSVATVKGHLSSIFDKLGVGNRHAAVVRALELTRPPGFFINPAEHRASTVAAP